MKIIVTGSLGNISRPLTEKLIQQGHVVTVISTKTDKQKEIEALGAQASIGSIRDVTFLTNTFTGADAVYCMLPPFDYFNPNLNILEETERLMGNYVKAIQAAGVKGVVHLSSIGAHMEKGNGTLAFHHLAENILRQLPQEISVVHLRPVSFYTNLYQLMDMIKGKGFSGKFMTARYAGIWNLLTGKTGVIASNYGGDDMVPWVAPADIADAITEELTAENSARKVRYVVSEELTCSQAAKIIGEAIGKPYLKWSLMSDADMLRGLKMFGIPQANAEGLVEMQSIMHTGVVNEDYNRNKPKRFGQIKMKDFAKEFAAVYKNK